MTLHRRTLPPSEGLAPGASNSQASNEKKTSAADVAGSGKQGPTNARNSQDVTVLLLDNTPLTRECLSLSINICDRSVGVLTAASASEAQQLLQGENQADVVLWNCGALDSTQGSLAIRVREVGGAFGRTPLIVLSDREDGGAVLEALELGAHGYIPSTLALPVALQAIRLVAAGGTFIPVGFPGKDGASDRSRADADVSSDADDVGDGSPVNGLTPRQRSVLTRLQEGKPNKIIAHELGMRESTVKVHVRNILKKLGATNRAQAVDRTLRDAE